MVKTLGSLGGSAALAAATPTSANAASAAIILLMGIPPGLTWRLDWQAISAWSNRMAHRVAQNDGANPCDGGRPRHCPTRKSGELKYPSKEEPSKEPVSSLPEPLNLPANFAPVITPLHLTVSDRKAAIPVN